MSNSSLIKRLTDERKNTWASAKRLLDDVSAEKRDLSATEDAEYRRYSERLDQLDARIRELTEQDERNAASEARVANILARPQERAYGGRRDGELDAAFRNAVLLNDRSPIDAAPVVRRSGYQPGIEMRDLSTSGKRATDSFHNRLMMHLVENTSVLAAGATVINSETGEDLKYPKSTADSTAAIVAEGIQIGESDPTISSVTIAAYKYAFLVQVTNELVEDVAFDLLGYVAQEAGRAVATAFGAHTVTGTGSSQPSGVITGASSGVTGGTGVTGAFTSDNLIDLYHSVASPYARSAGAGWLMNNSTLAAARKLKDSQNRYLFSLDVPSGSGASGTLLGRPVYISSTMANTGLSAKSVAFGDLSRYVVRSVGGVRFVRSDDFAFDYDVATFRCTARLGGALVDTGAVRYFTGGAS